MTPDRFCEITSQYDRLRIAIVGDFCLDRYFEIDPSRAEVSIETGLQVHNVMRVRTQPGAAGTILNNLVALGVGEIIPIGFCGMDGEGWLLENALQKKDRVRMDCFLRTHERATFTYSKPLMIEMGKPPRELNRLDQKNWSATPHSVSRKIIKAIEKISEKVDAMLVMDQVDFAETGVITKPVLECLERIARRNSDLTILADCRRGLAHYPPLSFKMNVREWQRTLRKKGDGSLDEIKKSIEKIALQNQKPSFVTLAENGIVGAMPNQFAKHLPAFSAENENANASANNFQNDSSNESGNDSSKDSVKSFANESANDFGKGIDIVGAGDSVTANLAAAIASGANIVEAMMLSMAGASIVIHKLGTTGTASRRELAMKMGFESQDQK